MGRSWPEARAALVAQLETVEAQAVDHVAESLSMFEFVTEGRQDVENYPLGYLLPVAPRVERTSGDQRSLSFDLVVRVLLAGPSVAQQDLESLHQRYDAWWLALTDAWDSALTIGLTADFAVDQEFTGLIHFEDVDDAWGFEMTIPARITETKQFSA